MRRNLLSRVLEGSTTFCRQCLWDPCSISRRHEHQYFSAHLSSWRICWELQQHRKGSVDQLIQEFQEEEYNALELLDVEQTMSCISIINNSFTTHFLDAYRTSMKVVEGYFFLEIHSTTMVLGRHLIVSRINTKRRPQ